MPSTFKGLTVELPNNEHIGSGYCVLYMEVVLYRKLNQFDP